MTQKKKKKKDEEKVFFYEENENDESKSLILSPYNSEYSNNDNDEDEDNVKDLDVLDEAMEFNDLAQKPNINYEKQNN